MSERGTRLMAKADSQLAEMIELFGTLNEADLHKPYLDESVEDGGYRPRPGPAFRAGDLARGRSWCRPAVLLVVAAVTLLVYKLRGRTLHPALLHRPPRGHRFILGSSVRSVIRFWT